MPKELVTATATFLTSVVFVVAMASLKVLATVMAMFLMLVAFVAVTDLLAPVPELQSAIVAHSQVVPLQHGHLF